MDSVLKRKKPVFDYSFNTTIAELITDPSIFWRRIEKIKIYHGGKSGCHKQIKIKRNKTELTFKCDCGVLLLYPPRKDRINKYMAVFISKEDYNARKNDK